MEIHYLDQGRITRAKLTETAPGYGRRADGFPKRSGAPTSYMIQIDGESRWRRVMSWCFSKAGGWGAIFVRVNGQPLVIANEYELMAMVECSACLEHGTGACQGSMCGQ